MPLPQAAMRRRLAGLWVLALESLLGNPATCTPLSVSFCGEAAALLRAWAMYTPHTQKQRLGGYRAWPVAETAACSALRRHPDLPTVSASTHWLAY